MVDKGKGITDDSSSAKRKRNGDDKSGNRKRKNHTVFQFFKESAFKISDSSEDEDFNDDDINMYFEDDIGPDPGVKAEPKTPNVPFFPKEEEMDEEEMDKWMEERYKPGAGFVKYAEDCARAARTDDWNMSMALEKDPTIWKVKCMNAPVQTSTMTRASARLRHVQREVNLDQSYEALKRPKKSTDPLHTDMVQEDEDEDVQEVDVRRKKIAIKNVGSFIIIDLSLIHRLMLELDLVCVSV